MKIFLIITLLGFVLNAGGAEAVSSPNLTIVAAKNKKVFLIKDLIRRLAIDTKIQESVDQAARFFSNRPVVKDPKADPMYSKIFARAQTIFEQEKPKIKEKMLEKMSVEFDKRFSEAELKYLADLTKYPIILKLTSFLDSDSYQDIINSSGVGASAYLKTARQEIMLEEKKEKTKK